MVPAFRSVTRFGAIVSSILLAIAALPQHQAPQQPAAVIKARPQRSAVAEGAEGCPHQWGPYIAARGDSVLVADQVSLAEAITNIPEFHDCQEFIVAQAGGGVQYAPIFAVFGAWDIQARFHTIVATPAPMKPVAPMPVDSVRGILASTKHVPPPSARVADARPRRGGPSALGLTEIYAEGDYAPLGIAAGFSCVYFYFAGTTLQAKVVNFGHSEQDCRLPVDPTALAGTVLQVNHVPNTNHPNDDDYPGSARWDWDAKDSIQYLGVKCGNAWCEVGPGAFTPSDVGSPPTAPRERSIKGWFDEQQLAPAMVANSPTPAALRGVLYPDPQLDHRPKAAFKGRWAPSSHAILTGADAGYKAKLNLEASSGATNDIDLCWGSKLSCLGPWATITHLSLSCEGGGPVQGELPEDFGKWWARVTSASGNTDYRCVRRRDHSDVDYTKYPTPRGTARWHWRADDEPPWMSCALGCCEIEPEGLMP